jgi:hypothetical protein
MVSVRALGTIHAEHRPISPGWAVTLTVAFVALGARAVEASGDSVSFTRIVVSAISLGAFFAVRRYSFIKGLLLALAVEVAAGTTLFVMVDLPFLQAHAPQLAVATVRTLERLEPRYAHAHVKLARV